MVPTDGRMRKAKERAAAAPRDEAPPARLFAGATWLLDRIAEQTGLEEDLRRVFPESWRELLSVAQFMALFDGTSLCFVRKAIAELAPGMNAFGNYDPGAGANGATVRIAWAFRRKRPRKGDELREERRLYVHVYHSLERATQDQARFGYFALATNEKMTAQEALHLYRAKDIVEKAFGNLKERLNLRRLLVSSEQGLDGKFFVAL